MNTLNPSDFATEQQIARNHARVSDLTDPTVPSLLAEWEAEQRAALDAKRAIYLAERGRQDALRAAGNDLPLFAL